MDYYNDQDIIETFPFANIGEFSSNQPNPILVVSTLVLGMIGVGLIFRMSLKKSKNEKVNLFLYIGTIITVIIFAFYQVNSWITVNKSTTQTELARDLIEENVKIKYKVSSVESISKEKTLENGIKYSYYVLGLENGQVLDNQLISRDTLTGEPFIQINTLNDKILER